MQLSEIGYIAWPQLLLHLAIYGNTMDLNRKTSNDIQIGILTDFELIEWSGHSFQHHQLGKKYLEQMQFSLNQNKEKLQRALCTNS